MQVIIGVDIGTSGTKAIAFTSKGTVIATAYEAYNPVTNMHGYHELDPDVLLNATITCLQKAVQGAKAAADTIAGVCFSAAMHSLIAIDASGRTLTHMLTWAD